jgi:hypothetical protein
MNEIIFPLSMTGVSAWDDKIFPKSFLSVQQSNSKDDSAYPLHRL